MCVTKDVSPLRYFSISVMSSEKASGGVRENHLTALSSVYMLFEIAVSIPESFLTP